MSGDEVQYLAQPEGLDDSAEYPHPTPEDLRSRMWGDTMWLSTIDTAAGIRGVNHIHLTNRGFGRFQAHFWIDGVQLLHASKAPIDLDPTAKKWSDGQMSYEVVEPFKRIRMTMDDPRFGYDLEFEARFPAFDYNDCFGGNPLWILAPVAGVHGGHFEQALTCRGTFEIRGGPNAGEVRTVDCLSHRDRTWSDRFGGDLEWEGHDHPDTGMHFWLILQFPSCDVHGVGFFDHKALGIDGDSKGRGGYVSTARGNERVIDVEPVPEYGGTATATAFRTAGGPDRWRFVLESGQVLHVRVTKRHATAKLWMRSENDLENPLDDFEDIVDLEIEETGESGYGVIEYSVLPPRPRWMS
jgi:hypothetical protein